MYILIYNEHACPTVVAHLLVRGGTGLDDQGPLWMADGIYIHAVALRRLNKSQCTLLQIVTDGASPYLISSPLLCRSTLQSVQNMLKHIYLVN